MKSLFITIIFVCIAIFVFSQNKQLVYQSYLSNGEKAKSKTVTYIIDDKLAYSYNNASLNLSRINSASSQKISHVYMCKKKSNKCKSFTLIDGKRNDLGEKNSVFSLKKADYIKEYNEASQQLNRILGNKVDKANLYTYPLILDFKVINEQVEKIGNYNCKLGEYMIDEKTTYKVWYTNDIDYAWTFLDYFRYLPGTIVKAIKNDTVFFVLEDVKDLKEADIPSIIKELK